jgi:hypothetical protein
MPPMPIVAPWPGACPPPPQPTGATDIGHHARGDDDTITGRFYIAFSFSIPLLQPGAGGMRYS